MKHRENYVNTAEDKSNNNSMSLKEKWHRMLGHVNFGYLNTLCKQKLLIFRLPGFEHLNGPLKVAK